MKITIKNSTYFRINFEENIGCYFFVFDSNGKCIKDFLQENEDQADLFAEEEYEIKRNSWLNITGNINNPKVTRDNIQTIIKFWDLKIITIEEIYDWANSIYLRDGYEVDDWEQITKDNNCSVTNEIVALFDTMDMNLISEIEIKQIQAFANTKMGNFKSGYDKFDRYLKKRNIKDVQMKLKDRELYRKFT